ncbi:glycosyltransferase family 8 protein [Campylobacter lari]
MYHIVFSADENYIKYTAVLIASIIKNTDKNKFYQENEIYYFHILSNDISNHTKNKLQKLEQELNLTFPCKIQIHIQNDEDFKHYPISGAAHSSKLPYYRLKLNSILDSKINTCLYLDSDMLCLCDIREIFTINLEGKIAGVVGDPGSKHAKIKFKENDRKHTLHFDENYFNSGFLLINLKEWKKHNIEQKCEDLASKCYHIKAADQDLLNATIKPQYQLKLDFSYNFNIITLFYAICKDEQANRLNYTRDEFTKSAKTPKILHYGEKPWKFLKSYTDLQGKNINDYWWQIAKKTPIFNEELLEQKANIKDHLLYSTLGFELLKAIKSFNFIKISSLIYNTKQDEYLLKKQQKINDGIFGLCCMLGESILYARKNQKNTFSVFLKAIKMLKNFKKYANKSRV